LTYLNLTLTLAPIISIINTYIFNLLSQKKNHNYIKIKKNLKF
jgi:hypothetical protein